MPDDMEALAYPNVVVDTSGIEISMPLVAYELSVSQEMGDRIHTGNAHEPIDESDTFSDLGIASPDHHGVYDPRGSLSL